MIPTFNSTAYLGRTLESVLPQARTKDHMQLQIVDNCSEKNNPWEFLNRYGEERIQFHRNDANCGAVPNFNNCIRHSIGRIVHILHSDDFVFPGFYALMESLHEENPAVGLIACRTLFVNENDSAISISPRLSSHSVASQDISPFLHDVPLQCSGVTVKRSSYESLGGFNEELIYAGDHEMWTRVVHSHGGLVVDKVLSAYRIYNGNETSEFERNGEVIRDFARIAELFAEKYGNFDRARFDAMLWKEYIKIMTKCRIRGEVSALKANEKAVKESLGSGGYWRRRFAMKGVAILNSLGHRWCRICGV